MRTGPRALSPMASSPKSPKSSTMPSLTNRRTLLLRRFAGRRHDHGHVLYHQLPGVHRRVFRGGDPARPWPPARSSPSAHRPPTHPTRPRLVHKSAPNGQRTRRSKTYRIPRPATLIKVGSEPYGPWVDARAAKSGATWTRARRAAERVRSVRSVTGVCHRKNLAAFENHVAGRIRPFLAHGE